MDYDSYLEKYEQNAEWQRKGATLSDKTARQEFGLTQDEIYDAIEAGTLQYRRAYMHGNPWLRLLRREVEALAKGRHGDRYVREQQDKPSWRASTARSGASGPSLPNWKSGDPRSTPASDILVLTNTVRAVRCSLASRRRECTGCPGGTPSTGPPGPGLSGSGRCSPRLVPGSSPRPACRPGSLWRGDPMARYRR
jgi:hypothetical protein